MKSIYYIRRDAHTGQRFDKQFFTPINGDYDFPVKNKYRYYWLFDFTFESKILKIHNLGERYTRVVYHLYKYRRVGCEK